MYYRKVQIMDNITTHGLIHEFIMKHKYVVGLYVIYLCIIPLKDIGVPHLFGKLVSSIENKTSLLEPLMWLFAISIIVNLGYSLLDYLEVELNPQLHAFVREKIVRHIMARTSENVEDIEAGVLVTKLLKIPTALGRYMNQWKYTFIPLIVLSIAAITYFSYYNVILGVLLAALIVVCMVVMYACIKTCFKPAYQSEKMISTIFEQVDDLFRNLTDVTNASEEDNEFSRMSDIEKVYRRYIKDTLVCSLKLRFLLVPFNTLYFATFIYICYTQVKSNKMKAATFVALVIILFRVFNTVWDISGTLNDTTIRWGLLRQSLDVINGYGKGQQPHGAGTISDALGGTMSGGGSGIEMKGIYFSYGHKQILSNFDLTVGRNESMVLVGSNGAGKTTILKLLLKQIRPDRGEISYNGTPYSALTAAALRQHIGYVPQNPVLFNRTVFENITYGLPNVSRNDVDSLVTSLKLDAMFASFPKGLDTPCGKYGASLSGGQRQVIYILRTILRNPDIVLMDEPTASIDQHTKHVVYDLLAKLTKDRTIIIVTHDEELKRHADKVVMLAGYIRHE